MLLITKEPQLEKVLKKYGKNVIIFNANPSGKLELNIDDKKMAFNSIDIMPDRELIKEFQDGSIGAKKLLKKHSKRLGKMHPADATFPQLFQIAKAACTHKGKKNKLVVLVLIEEDKKLLKLYTKVLEMTFKPFGLKFMENKTFKKIFKGKKKKAVKAINAYIVDKVNMSDKGMKYYKKIRKEYALEIAYIMIDAIVEAGEKIKGKTVKSIMATLIDSVKTQKKTRKAYEALRKIEVEGMKLPKVKQMKKLKKDYRVLVTLVHLVALRSGTEMGSKEYYKYVNPIIKAAEIQTEFKAAVKGAE